LTDNIKEGKAKTKKRTRDVQTQHAAASIHTDGCIMLLIVTVLGKKAEEKI
jgi:hypothetical protein